MCKIQYWEKWSTFRCLSLLLPDICQQDSALKPHLSLPLSLFLSLSRHQHYLKVNKVTALLIFWLVGETGGWVRGRGLVCKCLHVCVFVCLTVCVWVWLSVCVYQVRWGVESPGLVYHSLKKALRVTQVFPAQTNRRTRHTFLHLYTLTQTYIQSHIHTHTHLWSKDLDTLLPIERQI